MAAIEIIHVEKNYKTLKALDGVCLSIEEGEFFGLLGPNGAGKTTLISIIAGLARADAGQVSVLGYDVVSQYREARKRLGVVPQELVFDPFFTVRETLRMQSGYFGLKNNDLWIDEVMHHLNLTNKADANMRSLSGGMKRRVLVAQALVHKPPVIVLDEPTAGVDVELRQTLWQFISRLNREGHTIVLTTHYLEEAQALCNRIGMLKAGKIVALDETSALLKRIAGSQLTLRLVQGELPAQLMPLILHTEELVSGRAFSLRVNDYSEVEPILATLREHGLAIEDMHLQQADLEDVFIQIMGERTVTGFQTLFYKEVLRFWKVATQTITAPIVTAMLYLLIFGHVLEEHVQVYPEVRYTSFLIPGLVMMSVLQNAFANSSSSLIQSKITGNLVFVLLPPLSHWDLFGAYVLAAMVRGLAVGSGVFIITAWFADLSFAAPWWIAIFAFLGAAMLGTMGIIAGIWAEKFDQLAAFQNFLIMPATFLSGVFYSIHSLPPFWQFVSHGNPFFYMIDGFRYGFFGQSDVNPLLSFGIVSLFFVILAGIALQLLRSGYKLRH